MRTGLLLALAACGPSSSTDVDARGDTPGCAGMTFSPGDRLDGVLGGGHDPSATQSPLELWFARTGIVPTYDLEIATRASDTAMFDMETSFTHNSSAIDRDAALSADGLALVFVSDTGGTMRAYQSRRASTTEAFSAPAALALGEGVDNGIELSADGLTLYFADSRGDLRSAHRADRNAPFGAASEILASMVEFPTLSADELELYYSRYATSATYRRTRRNTAGAFDDTEVMVSDDAVEPDLTADGQRLYVVRSGAIWFLQRQCD